MSTILSNLLEAYFINIVGENEYGRCFIACTLEWLHERIAKGVLLGCSSDIVNLLLSWLHLLHVVIQAHHVIALLECAIISHQLQQCVLVFRVHHEPLLEELVELCEPLVVAGGVALHLVLQHLEHPARHHVAQLRNQG